MFGTSTPTVTVTPTRAVRSYRQRSTKTAPYIEVIHDTHSRDHWSVGVEWSEDFRFEGAKLVGGCLLFAAVFLLLGAATDMYKGARVVCFLIGAFFVYVAVFKVGLKTAFKRFYSAQVFFHADGEIEMHRRLRREMRTPDKEVLDWHDIVNIEVSRSADWGLTLENSGGPDVAGPLSSELFGGGHALYDVFFLFRDGSRELITRTSMGRNWVNRLRQSLHQAYEAAGKMEAMAELQRREFA